MGVSLRPARASDYASFERWFPMLGSGDTQPSAQAWATRFVPNTSIAEVDGKPAGYCYAQQLPEDGYVRHLVVEPSARGAGVGRALLNGAVASMRAAGCVRWRLNVRRDNAPAVALYTSMGLHRVRDCASMRFDWTLLEVLPAPSEAHHVRALEPADIDPLERRYALPPGQLASLTKTLGMVLRCAERRGRPGNDLSIAAFATRFPGCFPFRAASVPVAMTLLHGLRSDAALPRMGVVVEDHPELDAAFVQAGARVPFRFMHMVGPL